MKRKTSRQNIRYQFLVPGILLGCLGAWLLSGDPNWLFGLPVETLSLWLIWRAFPPKSGTLQPLAENTPAIREKDRHSYWAVVAVAAFWFFSYICFEKHWWVAGGAGMVLFLVSLYYLIRQLKSLPPTKALFSENAGLVLLIVFAVLMRFPFLNQNFTGLQEDEGTNLIGGIDVLKGELKTPFGSSFYFSYFPRFVWAFFMWVFGTNLVAARGLSALLSVISVFFFYRWCRLHFGVMASWVSAAFFSFCWWNLFFSLSAFEQNFTILFEVLSFYFLTQSLREGRRVYFGLSGIFLAASIMSYFGGRLALLIAAMALVGYWLVQSKIFLKVYWKHFLFLGLCFLWLIGPNLFFFINNPHQFLGRFKEINILGIIVNNHDYLLPFKRILGTFYSFFWPNQFVDRRFGLEYTPCLDPFLGIFCLLGLALAFYHFKQWKNLLAISGMFVGIISNAFAFAADASEVNPLYFHGGRCFIVFPFLCFLMAQGLDTAVRFIGSRFKSFGLAGVMLLAPLIVGSILVNSYVYYYKFHSNRGSYNALGFHHLDIADVIKTLYPRVHIVAEGNTESGYFSCDSYEKVIKFLAYQKIPIHEGSPMEIPIQAQVSKNVVLMFTDYDNLKEEENKVRKTYPRAAWKEYKNAYGLAYLKTVEIAKEDIQSLQKGLKLGPPLL